MIEDYDSFIKRTGLDECDYDAMLHAESIKEKDAEIERLNALVKHWSDAASRYEHKIQGLHDTEKRWSDLVDKYSLREGTLKMEIERLKAENEITVKVCNENTDLKLRINELEEENAHFAWRDQDKNKLITELASALDGSRFDAIHQRELVERAREATK